VRAGRQRSGEAVAPVQGASGGWSLPHCAVANRGVSEAVAGSTAIVAQPIAGFGARLLTGYGIGLEPDPPARYFQQHAGGGWVATTGGSTQRE